MDLRKQQLKVGKGAAAAAVLSVVFIAGGYYWFPFHLPELPTMGDRLAFTMRGELFAALILLAAIGTVGNQRALSAEAIDGSTVLTGSIDINRRVLQNTLEQLMLALLSHLCLATFVSMAAIKIIPILITWWIFGRIAFWYGYHQSPLGRAFGFGATMYPTIAVIFFDVYHVVFS